MRKAYIGRFLVFISIWSVVVYSPIARWTWHPQGWSRQRGAMDFAGGTAVHVCSGATVAAYCVFFQFEVRGWNIRNLCSPWWRKAREERKQNQGQPVPQVVSAGPVNPLLEQRERNLGLEMDHLDESDIHSVSNIVLGTSLLWFGWFGFNGGSAQGANLRAASAVLATHVAACAGGSAGLLLEWMFSIPSKLLRKDTKGDGPSVVGFCDGAISGLIAITPAAGFVSILFVWNNVLNGLHMTRFQSKSLQFLVSWQPSSANCFENTYESGFYLTIFSTFAQSTLVRDS